jgi:hypothetical protein
MKRKTALQKQTNKVIRLLGKLFSIKLVRIFLIVLVCIILLPFILFFILRPTVQKDINYGVNFSKKYTEEMGLDWKDTYIKILDELGTKNLRIVAYWDDSEKEKDNYDFSDVIWQIEEAKKRDANVIMAIGYKVPRYPECFEPDWVNKYNEEEREKELVEYVSTAVEVLKDYDNIKIWQIENEPFWPFGDCKEIKRETVIKEINSVKKIDNRPVLVQDSGEGGFWFPTYTLGDKLGISMYRKIWYNFWGIFFGEFIYFQYPLAHWTYKIKADIVGIPYEDVLVTELQAEPWGPGLNSTLTQEDIDQTMSHHHFISTLNYAQKGGFKDLYFWGAEWWLYMKEHRNDSYYWDTAKAIMNN